MGFLGRLNESANAKRLEQSLANGSVSYVRVLACASAGIHDDETGVAPAVMLTLEWR